VTRRISTIDATGAYVLDDVIGRLQRRGIAVLMSGVRPGHDQILATLGVAARLRREGPVFPIHPPRSGMPGSRFPAEPPAAAEAAGQLGAGPQM
jgi:hypothetical protein